MTGPMEHAVYLGGVKVGTAVRDGEGFSIRLTLSGEATAPRTSTASGVVFPPYGRSRGTPVAGADRSTLEYYRSGCVRTLEDPGKERWHERERALLAAIDAELAKSGGATMPDAPLAKGEDIPF